MNYRPSNDEILKNPIWKFLNDGNFPWLETKSDLIKKNGVTTDKISNSKFMELESSISVFQDMYLKLHFGYSEDLLFLPPTQFFGVFRKVKQSPEEDIEYRLKMLTEIFGTASNVSVSNTISYCWRFEPANITITVWPSELQSPNLTRAWIDPEREDACHISIETGITYVSDSKALDEYRRSKAIILSHVDNVKFFNCDVPRGDHYGSYRRSIKDLGDSYPLDIFMNSNNFYLRESVCGKLLYQSCLEGFLLVEKEQVKRVYVERLLPAKGGGGAHLYVDTFDLNISNKRLYLGSARKSDDLNDIAKELALAIGCKLKLGSYMYDY